MDPDVREALLGLPRSALEAAMREHDELGEGPFLQAHGYRTAERWVATVCQGSAIRSHPQFGQTEPPLYESGRPIWLTG